MAMTAEEREAKAELKRKLALRLLAFIGIAIVAMGLFALLASQGRQGTAAVGIGGMIFLASASVGGVLGFLFAVPRVLAQSEPDAAAAASVSGGSATPGGSGSSTSTAPAPESRTSLRARLLRSNTNLERISDWLTTMLVGVGLSQLGNVPYALRGFRDFVASEARVFPGSAGGPPTAGILTAIGPMLLIFGLLLGFLFLYLYTRLVLTTLFHDIEKVLDGGGRDPESQSVGSTAGEAVATAAENLRQTSKVSTSTFLNVGTDPSVADSLRVMFGLLYRPGGYEEVIQLSAKLSSTPAKDQAEYWFYLSAAFGQKYQALRDTNATDDELLSTRDNALDAARRAVDLDPTYRSRLWNISNRDNLDNDLAAFRDDTTFRAIVGVG